MSRHLNPVAAALAAASLLAFGTAFAAEGTNDFATIATGLSRAEVRADARANGRAGADYPSQYALAPKSDRSRAEVRAETRQAVQRGEVDFTTEHYGEVVSAHARRVLPHS